MDILIYRNQLKLEIDTETRKAGFFQINQANQEALNEAQLGNEFSDRAYFERKCQQGIDALLDVLHKFVVACNEEEVEMDEANNKLEDTKVWKITLTFDGRRHIISRSLASICHKMVAYHMLYSWAVMAYPNLVAEYKDQRAATLADIERLVYRKEAPILEPDGDEDAGDNETFLEKFNTLKTKVNAFEGAFVAIDAVVGSNSAGLSFAPAKVYTFGGMPVHMRYGFDTSNQLCAVCTFPRVVTASGATALIINYSWFTLEGNTTDGITKLVYAGSCNSNRVSSLPDWVKTIYGIPTSE